MTTAIPMRAFDMDPSRAKPHRTSWRMTPKGTESSAGIASFWIELRRLRDAGFVWTVRYLNSTPICFFLRQTTAQRRAAVSISSTSLKLSGICSRFAASIAAPVAETLRTMSEVSAENLPRRRKPLVNALSLAAIQEVPARQAHSDSPTKSQLAT